MSGTSDSIVISASKGIIQREHQHAVVGCKKFDPPNPFNQMTEEDVDRYRHDLDGGVRAESGEFNRLSDTLSAYGSGLGYT